MLKKILIALGVFTLLLAAAFITIALVYEKQVKKIIVGEINKQLISPVQVGDIEFSLIKNFPNIFVLKIWTRCLLLCKILFLFILNQLFVKNIICFSSVSWFWTPREL